MGQVYQDSEASSKFAFNSYTNDDVGEAKISGFVVYDMGTRLVIDLCDPDH